MKTYWGMEVKLYAFFDLGTRSASHLGRFTPEERTPVAFG
jgi:hypothetical protein